MKNRRIFLIILDSFGIGELPDAEKFGDKGANTLKSISSSPKFNIPNLIKLGLGNIDGVECIDTVENPTASIARMSEKSLGKDTTVGHWEISGLISSSPLPTYPNGFEREVIEKFENAVGRGIICNKPYSGTDVIRDYGKEHIETGKLIVYTSADSVFQIAAHEEIVPLETLYEYCRIARKILVGKHGVGRVIARPFIGSYPNFTRTANRRDFSLEPFGDTMLDKIKEAGLEVISVGKIKDIFAGKGITKAYISHSNTEGMQITSAIADTDFSGLCFTNLVDFDMVYGHRNNIDGYALALSEFDLWLEEFLKKIKSDDIVIITADHGCDPGDTSTDHTREYTPLLIYSDLIIPKNHGTCETFADISATICTLFDVEYNTEGKAVKLQFK